MVFVTLLFFLFTCSVGSLLTEIGHLYTSNANIDDVNSIAVDPGNKHIYATNTASGTIDIISYDITEEDDISTASLTIIRSIDIHLQSSAYFVLDYITSIAYSPKGYIIASLIPLNYAKFTGWLVLIDANTMYIEHFIELKYCFSPKHVVPTSDGNKLIISCEGLADTDYADPEGSITVIDTASDDANEWRIYNVDFKEFDDGIKALPSSIYLPKPDSLFSINAEPEYLTIDDEDHYAYIVLQENNGVAILDIEQLEIVTIFSFGAHDFGFSGLDASDTNNGINIETYDNVYGLRQPDGISYYASDNGKRYILTANEGNPKYYDTVRVSEVTLDPIAFPDYATLQQNDHLGRLQILNDGQNDNGEFEAIYTFGSRDFAVWEIEGSNDEDCPCEYPYGLRLAYSSYDDFEQITAVLLGPDGFNSDLYIPSADARSDDKGPEPESIIIGECSNGDVYVFIGLERVGGIMVYDITDIDEGQVTFVEYLNTRDFDIDYDYDTRPPENAGDVEPETLIFVADDDVEGSAYLIVGYKTSASIGVYSFNCGIHRNYDKDAKPEPLTAPVALPFTADLCDEQSPCLNVDIRPIVDVTMRRRLVDDTQYEVCCEFNTNNPFCRKTDDYFTYGVTLDNEENTMDPDEWSAGALCQIASCDSVVEFAIKDGHGCSNSKEWSVDIDGVSDIVCAASIWSDFCQWSVPTPRCEVVISTTSTSTTTSTTFAGEMDEYELESINEDTTDTVNNQYGEDNKKESRNTFDTMTNKGGHFYQSTMFYLLLSTCVLTCVGIIGCVVRHSKEREVAVEGDVHEIDVEEQVVDFEEFEE